MDVTINVQRTDVKDILKEDAKMACEAFAKNYQNQKVTSIRVLFKEERQWKIVEILLNAKNLTLHAAAKTTDAKASFGAAMDKLEKQMSRYLDKIQKNAVKADPAMKEKIWTSVELSTKEENADVEGYEYEL